MKVLVVVDDIVARRAVEAALQRGGFRTIGVADGLAAWEILKRADSPEARGARLGDGRARRSRDPRA
ncbi:MAG: response regulator, partial [Candidatus Eisenbacteria bacterium]|nr:response regulator [Candidatus Eisenbacteria bacterium]